MSDQPEITSALLLQHMQAMEVRLSHTIETLGSTLRSEFRPRLDRLERKTDMILMQIGNIDQHLDDIEIVMPTIKKKLNMR